MALLENSDPFSQLPNSVNTNPGNEFTNVGWLGGNAYTGNYGGAVQCETAATLPEPIISAIPACEKNAAKLGGISRQIQILSTLLNRLSVSTQRTNLQQQLDALRSALKCS